MAFIRAYLGVAFEFLVQMDFIQMNASCISSNNITSTCHVHASYCCICWCIDFRHRSVSIGPVPESAPEYLSKEQCPLLIYQASKPPLFIPIQSHSLAHALFYCIRTTTIHLLLDVVAEPFILCMTCHCHSK